MYHIFLLILFIIPRPGNAAPAPADFKGLVAIFNGIIDVLIPLIFTLTLIVFLWGVMKAWIWNAGDAEAIEKGKKLAVVGIAAFVIMLGIWGILSILRNTLFGLP